MKLNLLIGGVAVEPVLSVTLRMVLTSPVRETIACISQLHVGDLVDSIISAVASCAWLARAN